jgi:hypothetical protein
VGGLVLGDAFDRGSLARRVEIFSMGGAVPLEKLPDINNQDSIDEELRFVYPTPKLKAEVETLEARGETETPSQVTVETEQRIREENTAAVRHHRFPDQEGLQNVRVGNAIRDFDFLRRLNRCVASRFTHLNRPGVWRMECLRKTESGGAWEYADGVQAGMIPEYSTLYVDKHELPGNEMFHGWRTTLLNLIGKGFVSEMEAERVFGPATGPEAWRYRKALYVMRNGHAI